MNDPIDDIDPIPLKNLPFTGITAWKLDKWEPGDPVRPNNVLISSIDKLDRVSLVGRDREDGAMYFASSIDDIDDIIDDLNRFKEYLRRFND